MFLRSGNTFGTRRASLSEGPLKSAVAKRSCRQSLFGRLATKGYGINRTLWAVCNRQTRGKDVCSFSGTPYLVRISSAHSCSRYSVLQLHAGVDLAGPPRYENDSNPIIVGDPSIFYFRHHTFGAQKRTVGWWAFTFVFFQSSCESGSRNRRRFRRSIQSYRKVLGRPAHTAASRFLVCG